MASTFDNNSTQVTPIPTLAHMSPISQSEAFQLSGQFENGHFYGRWRIDGSSTWFEFDLEEERDSFFKGHFQLKNQLGTHKITETLCLDRKVGDSEIVGTGSNMFGEFKLWGKRDSKTNSFEGFKKYTVLHEVQACNEKYRTPEKMVTTGKDRTPLRLSSMHGIDDGFVSDDLHHLEQKSDFAPDELFDSGDELLVDLEDDEVAALLNEANNDFGDLVLPVIRDHPLHEPISVTCLDDIPPLSPSTTTSSSSSGLIEKAKPDFSRFETKANIPFSPITNQNLGGYSVRVIEPSYKEASTFKSRARKRIRDFVIGLQNRHFFPYDQNDLGIGLPDGHPMRGQIQFVKTEDQDTMQPSTIEVPESSSSVGVNSSSHQPRRKHMRLSSMSEAHQNTSAHVKPSAASYLSFFRHPGTSRSSAQAPTGNSKNSNSGNRIEYLFAKYEADGSCYEGETLNGVRHGLGVAGYYNGLLYIGEFRKGLEHGVGELRDVSGALIFRGEFENGKICGHGTFYYADGSVYRGEMREGTRHGKGIIWYEDGSLYEGDFVHGSRSGGGTFVLNDGYSQYSGEWLQDMRHGKGILRLQGDTVLDGHFKDNNPDGRCNVSFAVDGSFYEGQFKDGLKDGRGTYTFGKYNAVYEGRFTRDTIGGNGTLKLAPNVPIEIKNEDERKSEWMVPVDLQCEIRSVHLKAGFSSDGT